MQSELILIAFKNMHTVHFRFNIFFKGVSSLLSYPYFKCICTKPKRALSMYKIKQNNFNGKKFLQLHKNVFEQSNLV